MGEKLSEGKFASTRGGDNGLVWAETETQTMAAPQTWKEYFASWNNMCATGGGVASAPSGSATTASMGAAPEAKATPAAEAPAEGLDALMR